MIRNLCSVILVLALSLGTIGCTTPTMYRVSSAGARSDARCSEHVKPGERCEKRDEVSGGTVAGVLAAGTLVLLGATVLSGLGNANYGFAPAD